MSRISTDQPRLGELHDHPGRVDKYRNMLETVQANGLDNFSDYEVRFTASGYQLVDKTLLYMSSRDLAKTEPAFGRALKLTYKAMIPTSWPLRVRQYIAQVIGLLDHRKNMGSQKMYREQVYDKLNAGSLPNIPTILAMVCAVREDQTMMRGLEVDLAGRGLGYLLDFSQLKFRVDDEGKWFVTDVDNVDDVRPWYSVRQVMQKPPRDGIWIATWRACPPRPNPD
ncbi:hypothetical protein QBC37DRAFT_378220 [Rhypophila decipiens]|uniref:Uncharacterized protein n=1 Tax=Rhypophila decipiens TaxID=261697 RepID=A0AAN6Y129_9PEZI|nr:hypothetical protein QBC37DRAFT_378220 [Rhypophila decipiens]